MACRAAAIVIVATAAATIIAIAYWPGLMTWDAIRQYGQAVRGPFDDWHPPAMGWVWRQLIPIHRGPAPMLILQLSLYWSGFALLAGWSLNGGRRLRAVALLGCGFLPISVALMGAVLKDCLMAGALVAASGLLAWTIAEPDTGAGVRGGIIARLLAAILLLFAATLRFNGFLACLPLMVALLPARRRGAARVTALWIAAAVPLVLAMPVANRLIGAEPSGVQLSLVIFDLGGITEYAGVDMFPPLDVDDAVAVNHRCYDPVKWDSYSDWVDSECPLGFTAFRDYIQASGRSPYGYWLSAIARHPLAYAEHRLRHVDINMRFLVHDEIERPVQVESVPNIWGYRVSPTPLLNAIDRAAVASASTPLGWPIVWLALSLGALIMSPVLPSRRMIAPIAQSALLYGGTYAVLSVASELRYHLWTTIAALSATVLVAGDVAVQRERPWRRLAWAFAPALLVLVFATVWRLFAFGSFMTG